MAFVSNSSTSEDNNSGTNFSNIHTEDEEHIDTSTWTPTKQKKLQHMVEFHEEYQCVFGENSFYMYNYEKQNYTYKSPYA